MSSPRIVLAGAAGDLGGRLAHALVAAGAHVIALVPPELPREKRDRLERLGTAVSLATVAATDRAAQTRACEGAVCVVSALNGLRDVIVDRQTLLLDAARDAGVRRFIPSDYCEDFTHTTPGQNRNLDLRREFMARADRAPLQVTSIFNGAFLELLGAQMPLIQERFRRVLFWRSADQPLDFTSKDDVAAFTARAALDAHAPRILRIAGDSVTVRDLADLLTRVSGHRYRPQWAGSIRSLGAMIAVARLVAPQPGEPFPPWQGMQYMRDMFTGAGKLHPLDNARYGERPWMTVEARLIALAAEKSDRAS